MPQGNGMQAARTLREQGGEAVIIFITNMLQYALEGYEVPGLPLFGKTRHV